MTRHAAAKAAKDLRDGKLPRDARWHPEFSGWAILANSVEARWVPGFPTGRWEVLGPDGQNLDGPSPTTVAAAARLFISAGLPGGNTDE